LKAELECAVCLLERGRREILKATKDQVLRARAMKRILRIVSNKFGPEAVPAYIGTLRDRAIKQLTGSDPYKGERHQSNQIALKLLPRAESIIERSKTGYERFKRACMIAIAGNIIEFDVLGHDFNFEELDKIVFEMRLAIDHTRQIYELTKKAKQILFLLDNAGEIAFDTLLVKELQNLGSKVTVAVKDAPILNDATMNDAKEVGMHRIANELMTIGTDSIGLIIKDTSQQFRKKLSQADLLIAKGMAHYETITELKLKMPVAYLFRAKCYPVAHSVGVARDSNVALLKKP